MKALFHWISITLGLFFISLANATSVSLGTIEQPINLAAASDPASIPLGPVVYEANYDYGVHKLITAARPCQHGAMEWQRGNELDQNLASVFGISLEPEDPTQINYAPVTIRMKNWDIPKYSPYSREQVLAATIHCLLRSAPSSPSRPITIKILAEEPTDQIWAKKYEGKYINQPDSDSSPVKPTAVPGTQLLTDKLGITYVQFPNIKNKSALATIQPTLIPFRLGEDYDTETYRLLPIWVGSSFKSPLDAIGRPYRLIHDMFNPSAPSANEVNALFDKGDLYHWSSSSQPDSTSVSFSFQSEPSANLAAALHALVQTVQPSQTKPLTITLRASESNTKLLKSMLNNKDWIEAPNRSGSNFSCSFVVDPNSGDLIKGSIPLLRLKRTSSSGLYLELIDKSE